MSSQSQATQQLSVPAIFRPLFKPARYKAAHGGRGSGKSWFFATAMVLEALNLADKGGLRAVCIREVQKSLKESAKRLIEDRIQALGVGPLFDVQTTQIGTPGGGLVMFQGMQDHTAESIKSLEGFQRAWVEEAQTLSERSLDLLRPTIRADGSELWFSWNPTRKTDAVDVLFRGEKGAPPGSIMVEANYFDNPFLPDVLRQEATLCLENDPDKFDHIWFGEYAKAFKGAYFAEMMSRARLQERIGKAFADPLMPVRAYVDIGGAGRNADAMAIWIVQFAGEAINVLDYIEGQGQVLAYYVAEMRRRGWTPKEITEVVLPHDGMNTNNVTGKRYKDHWEDAGYATRTLENQGKGAAMMRVEAVRRIFSRCSFDEKRCSAGLDALGFYHEKRDEQRNVGLGPDHDWSSHGADAFGLMAVDYEEPRKGSSVLNIPAFGAV